MRQAFIRSPAMRISLSAACLVAAVQVCAGPWVRQRGSLISTILDLDIASPEVVYAVGERGLIHRSRDAGLTWTHLPAIDAAFPPDYHAVDFCDADHGLVASVRYLLSTRDGGETWSQATFPGSTYFGSIAYPTRDAAYFSGSTGLPGIWKSADGGSTWTPVVKDTVRGNGAILGLHFVTRDTGFALRGPVVLGADYRVMATQDGGETWTEWRVGLPKATLYHDSIVALRFADARTGYALGWRLGPVPRKGYCLKTRDGGATWDSIPSPPGLNWDDLRFTHPDTGWSLGTKGLAETVDGGATWTIRGFINVRNMHAFRMGGINANGFRTGFAGGTSGHILRTGEGAAWEESTPFVSPVDLLAVQFPRPDTGFAVGAAGLVLRTRDGGRTWGSFAGEPVRYQGFAGVHFPTARTGFLVGGDSGSVLRTGDGGATWTWPAKSNDERMLAIWFASETVGIAVGEAGRVIRSVDRGMSWTSVPSGTARALRAVHFPTAQLGFAAGDSGTLLKTSDAGAHWAPVSAGVQVDWKAVRFLDGSTGFLAGSGAALLKTKDGGATWTPRTVPGAGQGAFYSLAFTDGLRGLAVGTGHLWETADAGETWSRTVLPGSPSLYGADFDAGTAYVVGEDGRILASGTHAVSIAPLPAPMRSRTRNRLRGAAWIMFGPDGLPRNVSGRLQPRD